MKAAALAQSARILDRVLVIHPNLRRAVGETPVFYLEGTDAPVCQLDPDVVDLLGHFALPASAAGVFSGEGPPPRAPEVLQRLIELGFLLSVEEAAAGVRRVARPRFTAFGLPEWSEDAVDVVILGACTDAGTPLHLPRGAALGPGVIRDCSQAAAAMFDDHSGTLLGWHDLDTARTLLCERRVADAGDVWPDAGTPATTHRARLLSELSRIREANARCLLFGGDHSVSLSAVQALPQRIGVLWVDAHADLDTWLHPADVTHGNVARWILQEPHVADMVQLGSRGSFAVQPRSRPASVRRHSVAALRAMPTEERRHLCLPDLPYYVSVDIDVLDPSVAPDTGSPVTGGLQLAELKQLLRDLTHGRTIVGADVVEVMPSQSASRLTGTAAAEVALLLMDAMCQ